MRFQSVSSAVLASSMARGDRGLEAIGPEPSGKRLRPLQRGEPAPDEELVPASPILIEQEDRLSRRSDPGAQSGGLDLHQAPRGHAPPTRSGAELREDPAEAQRLLAERGADPVLARGGGVALVEDEIDDLEHRREPGRQLLAARHLERHLGLGERPLGAHDPLRQRRLRHEEGAGDLLGGEPAEQAKGERDPRLGREHRMAGDEDEAEEVVADVIVDARRRDRAREASCCDFQLVAELPFLAFVHRATAQLIDRAVLRGGHQPGARLVGHTRLRPTLQRRDQGVLRQVLGHSHVAHEPGEAGDEPRRLDSPDRLDGAVGVGSRHGYQSGPAAPSKQGDRANRPDPDRMCAPAPVRRCTSGLADRHECHTRLRGRGPVNRIARTSGRRRHERRTTPGRHAEGRFRPQRRWQAGPLGGLRSLLRGLGDLPYEGLAGGAQPACGPPNPAAGSARSCSDPTTEGRPGRRSATSSLTTACPAPTSGMTALSIRGSSRGSGTSSRRDRSRDRVRGRGRRGAVPLHRRRAELEGALRPSPPQLRPPVAARRRRHVPAHDHPRSG